ncbi:Calvin cycle protein cp12-1 protein [Thalictrum thalictroides]|uniref:Calvin cycle protein cp12-1 protein n=1 Tax=Thalictrum thalictroides TaxID=46969 RepID=A0A7J6VPI9_THATH|nr:Calvin cycle protein cp12-1 protein [Thalictrum thalictroides]KAF5198764.1 Calvin cycle protein cp12-1 protein [Thalictrum thalictroides]
MATTLTGVSLSTTVVAKADSARIQPLRSSCLNHPWKLNHVKVGRMSVRTMVAPDSLSEKVSQSIEEAKETCADDPVSGECAAAWDEVEEVSAAANDARRKKKEADSDPLEVYCKDNPETDECRTYDD